MYGVIVQPITNDTTPANVESYGDIVDMDHCFDKGFSRDFCDGQTSPVPPRWADDQAGMLYTYDRRTAEMFQGILREDVAARVAGGQLAPSGLPSWGRWVPKETTRESISVVVDKVEDYDDYVKASGEWYHGSDIGFGGGQSGRQYGATYITDRMDVAVDYGQPYALKVNSNAVPLDLAKWDDTKEFLDRLKEADPEHFLLEHGYSRIHPDLVDQYRQSGNLSTAINENWSAVRSEVDDILGEMDFNLGGGFFDFEQTSDIIKSMGRSYVLDTQGNGIIYDFGIVDKVTRIVLME